MHQSTLGVWDSHPLKPVSFAPPPVCPGIVFAYLREFLSNTPHVLFSSFEFFSSCFSYSPIPCWLHPPLTIAMLIRSKSLSFVYLFIPHNSLNHIVNYCPNPLYLHQIHYYYIVIQSCPSWAYTARIPLCSTASLSPQETHA